MPVAENKAGLTLIETTISLGLLMIGIMASVTLMLASFNRVEESEQEIVIVNLAREGIEIARAIRNNENANNPNDIDIFSGSYDGYGFNLDCTMVNTAMAMASHTLYNVTDIKACANCSLYLKNGAFSHDASGEKTIYKRMVKIKPGVNSAEKIISSEVTWGTKGRTHSYVLEAVLTDWQ